MPRKSSLDRNADTIRKTLEGSPQRVFTAAQFGDLYSLHKEGWGVSPSTPAARFTSFAEENGLIERKELRPEDAKYKAITRYLLPHASAFEVALRLRPRSYLSHSTAVFLHGISDQLPKVIYANQEQGAKPGRGELSQAGLDRAFNSRQRLSAYTYWYGDQRLTLLSGKSTGDLGVVSVHGPNGEDLRVTGLERTLIDIVVRPVYAGGVYQVLEAFRGARGKVSVAKLVRYLDEIGHMYPYHQAIGFLMERAGFSEADTKKLKSRGAKFDFYLAHGLKERDYDKNWRLYYPRSF